MSGQTGDFVKDWQVLAQQSWDAWLRQLQHPPATPQPVGNEVLDRTLAGLKGCFDWMQGMAAAGASQPGADWQSLLRAWAGAGNQPFTQAFAGIDSNAAQGFIEQWQAWLRFAHAGGFPGMGATGPVPAFGPQREDLMQQQDLVAAVQAAVEANARYQALIQRANAKGLELLQRRLVDRDAASRPIDSLKALYDVWVDAAEEAYAEIALTDEFRTAYGDMVNSQMQVRQLQQKQTAAWCRELGLPTREEVSALGERLQQVRREIRKQASGDMGAEVLALRREVSALRRELAELGASPAGKASHAPKPKPSVRRVAAPARRPSATTARKR